MRTINHKNIIVERFVLEIIFPNSAILSPCISGICGQ